jgi:hypothetical protein
VTLKSLHTSSVLSEGLPKESGSISNIAEFVFPNLTHNFSQKDISLSFRRTSFPVFTSFLLSDGVSYLIFLNSNLSIGRLFVGVFQTQGLDVQATSFWSRLPFASSSENNKPDIWVHPSPNLR